MPSKNPTIQKAYKDGKITKGQYDKLGDALLLGIIKKKKGGGTKKEKLERLLAERMNRSGVLLKERSSQKGQKKSDTS